MKKEDIILSYFYNPTKGYTSSYKLYQKLLKDGHSNISLDDVTNVLNKQYTNQINFTPIKPKIFNTIISPLPKHNFQMDIIIYDRYEFHNYKYILCVIDVYSRFAQCRALTNRREETILSNIKDIFDIMGIPKNINCDNEFNKSKFNNFFDENNITMYFSQPNDIIKNSIVERFNRTIINKIQLWRTATGKYNWYKILNDLVDNYNNSIHSTTKETPYDLFNEKTHSKQMITYVNMDMKIGDQVRVIYDNKDKLSKKSDVEKYSKQIYTISKIDKYKIYLTNEEGKQLKNFYRPYNLKKIDDVQYYDRNDDEQYIEHIQTQQKNKLDKGFKKEGIDLQNIQITKRERKRNTKYDKDFV